MYLVYYYIDPYSDRPFYAEYINGTLEDALNPNKKFKFKFYISVLLVDNKGHVVD